MATALAVAFLCACSPKGEEAVRLVPEGATILGSMDVRRIVRSSLFTGTADEGLGELARMLEAARACHLGPERFERIVIGAELGTGRNVLVVDAPGIGKLENLACIARAIEERTGKEPWEVAQEGGKAVLKTPQGVGYLVTPDQIAIASSPWAAAVRDRIAGRGSPAITGSLKELYVRAGRDKPLWLTGRMPQVSAATATASIADFSAEFDLTAGVEIHLAGGMATPEEARDRGEQLRIQFAGIRASAAGLGIPQGILDSVKFGNAASVVTIDANISEADFSILRDRMKEIVSGMIRTGMPDHGTVLPAPPPPTPTPVR